MSQAIPTKSNLLKCKKSLELAALGYDLLDRKRSVMMRELAAMTDRMTEIRAKLEQSYHEAYEALQRANFSCGKETVMRVVKSVPPQADFAVRYRSVMGIELPGISLRAQDGPPPYGMYGTDASLDRACLCFRRAAALTAQAAELESGAYRLSAAIKKTGKRANALKNIVIPSLQEDVRYISDYLEEKEREEFTAHKVVKNRKNADPM